MDSSHENGEVVDYDDSTHKVHDETPRMPETQDKQLNTPTDEQKSRITSALNNWCKSNIVASDEDADDVNERSEALAEVGMLLVFEYEKYPDAVSLRAELQDIESIIGGESIVTKFVNFLLSLQNQIKKANAIAAAKENKLRAAATAQTQPAPIPTGPSIPMQFRPAAQPVIFHPQMWQQQQPMFQTSGGFPPRQAQSYPGNMIAQAPHRRGIQKVESEYEIKKNQILGECTEHLKVLIEKASKATDPKEKAAVLELIKKVKARMESLKTEGASPPARAGVARVRPSQ